MTKNHFHETKGPFPLSEIAKVVGFNEAISDKNNLKIHGFETLSSATNNDMTFLNSNKYKEESLNTKAAACITSLTSTRKRVSILTNNAMVILSKEN